MITSFFLLAGMSDAGCWRDVDWSSLSFKALISFDADSLAFLQHSETFTRSVHPGSRCWVSVVLTEGIVFFV